MNRKMTEQKDTSSMEMLQKKLEKAEKKITNYESVIFKGKFRQWVFETLYKGGEIIIVTMLGDNIRIPVTLSTAIYTIKGLIYEKTRIPVSQIILISGGNELEDCYTLFHYSIPVGAFLFLKLNLHPPRQKEMKLPSLEQKKLIAMDSIEIDHYMSLYLADKRIHGQTFTLMI